MVISEKDKLYLLSLKPEDLTFSKLVDLFGDTINLGEDISKERHSHFNTTDEMTLYPRDYFVTEPTQTTVGRFIYNKYIVERIGLQNILGYVNIPLTAGNSGKNEAKLSKALIEDKMTINQFYDYIDYRDNLGMQLHSVITTSFTMNTIKTPSSVQKRKKNFLKSTIKN